MTTEQLNQARATAWRQAGNPLLTADDSSSWLRETGVCLFLPRPQLATAAPSFVEATLGAADPAPRRAAIEAANELLRRLLTSEDAIAMNLLGTHGPGLPGDQPDFLATPETLPFLFALQGDKEWKRGPRGKSSPLTIEVWKLLGTEDALTAEEVKDKLGRQLTEAAALRALIELWSHLRIEPLYSEGEPARWQLLERRHLKRMQAGSNFSQAVALSALVSLYLQSAIAASSEEVEIFLSPLASRSKVRDVIKGLTATRQLATLNLGASELFHVEGSLPEFPEISRAEGVVVEDLGKPADREAEQSGSMGEGRRRFVARRIEAGEGFVDDKKGKPRTAKPAAQRSSSESSGGASTKRASAGAETSRRSFAPRPSAPSSDGGERRAYGTRSAGGGGSFNPREPWKEDRRPSSPGGEEKGRRAAAPRTGDRKAFKPREGEATGERRPFKPREGGTGDRKPFAPRAGDRPFKPRPETKPFGERKPYARKDAGERKPFSPRAEAAGGERRPFTPRAGQGGERKSYSAGGGARPFKGRPDGKPFGERKSFGERKPFTSGGERERKTFPAREGSSGVDRKPFAPRSGDRPFQPRAGAKPYGERKPFAREGAPPGDGKPSFPRAGDRPFKPRANVKSFGDRKPSPQGEGGSSKDRKPFAPRSGARPFQPGTGSRPFSSRKPFTPRAGGAADERGPAAGEGRRRPGSAGTRSGNSSAGPRKPAGAPRARTASFTSSGRPRPGAKAAPGRPGPRATRGAAAKGSARAGFKRPGKPGKGRSK